MLQWKRRRSWSQTKPGSPCVHLESRLYQLPVSPESTPHFGHSFVIGQKSWSVGGLPLGTARPHAAAAGSRQRAGLRRLLRRHRGFGPCRLSHPYAIVKASERSIAFQAGKWKGDRRTMVSRFVACDFCQDWVPIYDKSALPGSLAALIPGKFIESM